MSRPLIIAALLVSIITSLAGFPFEAMDAHEWAGALFVAFALSLVMGSLLIAVDAARSNDDPLAVGFVFVGLYGFGTALNSSLLARGLADESAGIQPGVWGALALGFVLIGMSCRFPIWVRIVGLLSAAGHVFAATALLFGAELPHTGAESTDLAPLAVAISKLLFWGAVIGWILAIRREPPAGRS